MEDEIEEREGREAPSEEESEAEGTANSYRKTLSYCVIDDEKVKPIEVDLSCKTYPKEHEAFTAAFLRLNNFARENLHWGRQAAQVVLPGGPPHLPSPLPHLTRIAPAMGAPIPGCKSSIRNGPSLRGPVVLVQQKKSPNAETVVFDQVQEGGPPHAPCRRLPTPSRLLR